MCLLVILRAELEGSNSAQGRTQMKGISRGGFKYLKVVYLCFVADVPLISLLGRQCSKSGHSNVQYGS